MRVFNYLAPTLLLALVTAAGAGKSLSAQATAQDHPGQYSSVDIENGARLYANQCSLCHGPNGEQVQGVDLRRGQFRRPMSDDDLARTIVTGVPNTGMPPFALQRTEIDGLVAFIRAGFDVSGTAVKVGDVARGRTLFEGKAACITCHRVGNAGSRTAPDLSDIGAIRPAAVLQRKLADPTATMLPINRPVRIVTRDGRTIHGRRLNEDTFTVQVLDAEGGLVSLVKADLREYELAKTSPMPSVSGKLSADEVADLIAYLLSLKG
jgi:putative heme-binding domain-containing protein